MSFRLHKIYTDFPQFKTVQVKRLKDLKGLDGNYVKAILRSDTKITAEEVEEYAKGKFLVRVEHEGEEKVASDSVHTLAPAEAIARYVIGHAKDRDQERLVELGDKLYRGED